MGKGDHAVGDEENGIRYKLKMSKQKGKPPARVFLFAFGEFTFPALFEGKGEFRSLRRASQGSALITRKPLKRLDLNF